MLHNPGIGHNNPPNLDSKTLACPRVPIRQIIGIMPAGWLQYLYQHAPNDCCKHALNHDIEAYYSGDDRRAPDIYEIICKGCGSIHRRFCVGASINSNAEDLLEYRPKW